MGSASVSMTAAVRELEDGEDEDEDEAAAAPAGTQEASGLAVLEERLEVIIRGY